MMDKKQLIFLLAITIFGIQRIHSQTDFREGYIVKNNNDTVFGLIDYKGNKSNSKMCIFKHDPKSKKQIFTPSDIKEYRFINNKYYVSKSLDSENNKEKLFLEFLINGIVDIYYYRDASGEHYLIDKGDNQLRELVKKEIEVFENGTRYIREAKEYVGMLKYIFNESPSVSQKVDNVSLSHKSLIKIAHDYHSDVCSNEECIIYERDIPKIKIKFGPLVGVNLLSLSSADDIPVDYYYLRNDVFENLIYPSIGFFIKTNIPSVNERFFIQYEATFSQIKLEASNLYIEPTYNMNLYTELELTKNNFNNLIVMRYEFPKGIVRPTFHLGGFLNYSFTMGYIRNFNMTHSWGTSYESGVSTKNPFSQFDYGLNIGLGIKTETPKGKEVFLDIKYQRGFGWIEFVRPNYLGLNLGVQI